MKRHKIYFQVKMLKDYYKYDNQFPFLLLQNHLAASSVSFLLYFYFKLSSWGNNLKSLKTENFHWRHALFNVAFRYCVTIIEHERERERERDKIYMRAYLFAK